MIMWRKPEGLKYTDLCIFIDEHSAELANDNPNDQTVNLIYNYIYLLVKALSIKKRMFENFNDYEGYALQSANRLFFALKKSYLNEGKIIKGKTIKPIKSILNYTKALLYPMKLEYLNTQYDIETNAQTTARQFDKFSYKQHLKDTVWESQNNSLEFKELVNDLFRQFNQTLDAILLKSPFRVGSIEYKYIKMSILLNCLHNLKNNKGINADPVTIIVWKLPKSVGNYIRLFITDLGAKLKKEIMTYYNETQVDEKILDYIISNPEGEFKENEN